MRRLLRESAEIPIHHLWVNEWEEMQGWDYTLYLPVQQKYAPR